jgi:hypothetical protein
MMIADTLQRAAHELIGKLCWRVSAGVITGSRMNLDLGTRIQTEIGNDKRLQESGEFGIQIGSAQWRISSNHEILASSVETIEEGGAAITGIRRLEGKHVTEVNVSRLFDLQVKFENDFELQVFCNDPDDGADNYTLSIRERYYSIECSGRAMELNIEE